MSKQTAFHQDANPEKLCNILNWFLQSPTPLGIHSKFCACRKIMILCGFENCILPIYFHIFTVAFQKIMHVCRVNWSFCGDAVGMRSPSWIYDSVGGWAIASLPPPILSIYPPFFILIHYLPETGKTRAEHKKVTPLLCPFSHVSN